MNDRSARRLRLVPRHGLDLHAKGLHLFAMTKKIEATVARNAKTGRITVRKNGSEYAVKNPAEGTSSTVRESISKNRDALQRLANR